MNAAKEAKEANLNIKDGPRKIGMHSFLLEKKAHKTSRFNQEFQIQPSRFKFT